MVGRLNNTSLRLTYLRVLAQGEVQAQPDLEDQTQEALNNNKTTIKLSNFYWQSIYIAFGQKQGESFISTKIKSETKYQNEAKKQYKNIKITFSSSSVACSPDSCHGSGLGVLPSCRPVMRRPMEEGPALPPRMAVPILAPPNAGAPPPGPRKPVCRK